MRYKPFPIVNFDKQLERDNKPFRVIMTPPSKIVRLNGSEPKVGVPFRKMMSREATGDLFTSHSRKGAGVQNIGSVISTKDLEKLSTVKRVISPSFKRFKARYRNNQLMPSFMENVNNRISIEGLSYEMLKANNYFEVERGSPVSTCSPKKSFNRKIYSPISSPTYKNYSTPHGIFK